MAIDPGVFREIGVTGLKSSYGLIQEELLRQLQGDKAVKVYQEMGDNDPVVGAVLYALENTVRQVTWSAEGPEKAFLEDQMRSMEHSWEDFISEALSKLQYGWAYHEVVYEELDGRVRWAKLPIRAQSSLSRWELGPNGQIHGMWQGTGVHEVLIPSVKALHFRTSTRKNDPQGRSVLRSAYRPWWFRKRIEEIEAIGIERDLAGIPVAGIPAELMSDGADQTIFEAWKDIIRNVRNDEQAGIVKPNAFDEHGNALYTFELMSSSGRRQFVTGDIIARKSVEIAQSALADVILVGHESVGSFALSETKERALTTGLQSQVDEIAATVNRQGVPRLLGLNGIDESSLAPDRRTRVVAGRLTTVDMKSTAEIILKLSMAGMALFPSEDLEAKVRTWMDFPAAEGSELVVNPNTGARMEPGTVTEVTGGDTGPPAPPNE